VTEKAVMQVVETQMENTDDLIFDEFIDWFNNRVSGLQIIRVAGGWLLVTKADYSDAIRRLKTSIQKTRFSKAALETLAIIAYRQPVSTPEIEQIRGVDSSGILRNLLEKKMITVLGRKRCPGNPLLYGTTNHFLVVFGLDNISSLPTLEEFESVFEDSLRYPGHLLLPGLKKEGKCEQNT
jgi:segregation and condensation protein B